jgi:hypothetical protein
MKNLLKVCIIPLLFSLSYCSTNDNGNEKSSNNDVRLDSLTRVIDSLKNKFNESSVSQTTTSSNENIIAVETQTSVYCFVKFIFIKRFHVIRGDLGAYTITEEDAQRRGYDLIDSVRMSFTSPIRQFERFDSDEKFKFLDEYEVKLRNRLDVDNMTSSNQYSYRITNREVVVSTNYSEASQKLSALKNSTP